MKLVRVDEVALKGTTFPRLTIDPRPEMQPDEFISHIRAVLNDILTKVTTASGTVQVVLEDIGLARFLLKKHPQLSALLQILPKA